MENKKTIDFMSKKKILFIIPIVFFAVTLIVNLIFGLEVDIEFKGGTLLSYSYTGEIDTNLVKSTVEGFNAGTVKVSTGSAFGSDLEILKISFSSSEGIQADVQTEITNKLIETFPDSGIAIHESQDVNPSAGFSFFLKCLVAVLFSFVLLVIYIAFRFKKIGGMSAGMFAIIALLHDVFYVYATFVFFRLPIDANFMAVVLTILGYSINNTIVTYDRVRENRVLHGKKYSISELVNVSVTQTLSRSIKTTVTTAVAVVAMIIVAYICGIESIISFVLPMFVGLIAGTYSSVCLVGPMWATWQEHKIKSGKTSK